MARTTQKKQSVTMLTSKMNVVKINGSSSPECTNCGYRFETDYAENPYKEMCKIAFGKNRFCPMCGAKYVGCQIEGIDFNDCDPYLQDWIRRGLK